MNTHNSNIDAQAILSRLNLKDVRSIGNILKNENLCARIMKERPINIKDFNQKKRISGGSLKKLIDSNLISIFSNVEDQGSPKFIFENEVESFIDKDLAYDMSMLPYIKETAGFFFDIIKEKLSNPNSAKLGSLF